MNSGHKVLILSVLQNNLEFSLIFVAYGSDWVGFGCVSISVTHLFNTKTAITALPQSMIKKGDYNNVHKHAQNRCLLLTLEHGKFSLRASGTHNWNANDCRIIADSNTKHSAEVGVRVSGEWRLMMNTKHKTEFVQRKSINKEDPNQVENQKAEWEDK